MSDKLSYADLEDKLSRGGAVLIRFPDDANIHSVTNPPGLRSLAVSRADLPHTDEKRKLSREKVNANGVHQVKSAHVDAVTGEIIKGGNILDAMEGDDE